MDWVVGFILWQNLFEVFLFLSIFCSDHTLLHPSSLGNGPVEPQWSPASVPDWLCPFPTDWWSGAQQRNGHQLSYFPASGGPSGSHQHACLAQHPVLLPTFLHLSGICHGPPSFLPVWPVQSEQGMSEIVNCLCFDVNFRVFNPYIWLFIIHTWLEVAAAALVHIFKRALIGQTPSDESRSQITMNSAEITCMMGVRDFFGLHYHHVPLFVAQHTHTHTHFPHCPFVTPCDEAWASESLVYFT